MKPRFYSRARTVAEQTLGVKIPYAPGKRHAPVWRWYLILLIIATPLIYFVVTATSDLLLQTAPGYVFLQQYEVRASSAGYINKMAIKVGDVVQPGQQLALLHDPLLAEQELKLRDQVNALRPVAPPAMVDLRASLQEQIHVAEHVVRVHGQRLQAVLSLYQRGAATLPELNAARLQVSKAQSDLNSARTDLARNEQEANKPKGVDAEYLNNLQRLKSELGVIEHRKGQLAQTTAYAGRIIDMFVNEGEYINAGSPLLLIGRPEESTITAFLDPKHMGQVKLGTPAQVRFPDGSMILAKVSTTPSLTRRLPPDLVNTFGFRPLSLVITLKPDAAWPDKFFVHGLPVNLRFRFSWEESWQNRFLDAVFSILMRGPSTG